MNPGALRRSSVRIPDETYERLKVLSARTGRTTTYYVREAIEEHLDDFEDVYLAEQTLEQIRRGEETVVSAEDFWRDLEG